MDNNLNTSALFHSLLRNSKVAGIFIISEEGIILETNLGVHKSFGYQREEIIGENFSILYTPEDQKKNVPQNEIKQTLESGSAIDNNFIVHKDGSHKWVNGESILSKDANRSFIIKIIYDIDSQKELEKELIQKKSDFNSFVYIATHDLKAPISNIEGLVSMLPDTRNNEEAFSQIYDMLKISVEKFKSLLDELPAMAKNNPKEKERIK